MSKEMFDTLAPEDVLKAALFTLNRATVLMRNGALPGGTNISKESLLKLAEAIHDVPQRLINWKAESLNELKISFGSFKKDSWPAGTGLDLLSIFEAALRKEYK